MKTALSSIILQKAFGWFSPTNCGRKAKKKIVSLGFSRLIRTPETMTYMTDGGAASSLTTSASVSRRVLHAI